MAYYNRVPITPLETERLLLRPLSELDAPRIQTIFPHLNVLRYMAAHIPWPYPEDGAAQHLSRILPRVATQEEYDWAITRKGQGDEGLIGLIAVMPNSDENRGFWLGEDYWGQGYMREAVTAVNDFAFDILEMEEMLLTNANNNTASQRLKEISGAEIVSEGEGEFVGGTFTEVRWRLNANAWRKHRAKETTA